MQQSEFVSTHHPNGVESDREHRGTSVRVLRAIYGSSFAPGFSDDAMLSLEKLDARTLSRLLRGNR